jgi:hypothetical protein
VNTLQNDLAESLNLDLLLACEEFGQARQRQIQKDTPAHRAAVAECLTRIDACLDMWLDLHPAQAGS